jgi:curved DNA-binding protein CbpA
MFVDYYALLQISSNSTPEEIKSAFKREAIKWHPDRNRGIDTTIRMQLINEAYLILKDPEARFRYDKEYRTFQLKKENTKDSSIRSESKSHQESESKYSSNHDIEDETLKKWIENAKRQAVELAKATLDDLTGMIAVGTKVAFKESLSTVAYFALFTVVIFIISLIFKSC